MGLINRINEFVVKLPNVNMNKHFYIWGTGNTASLYQEGLNREKDLIIYGYADNNSSKWGGTFSGKKIFSPDEVRADADAIVLICSPQPSVVAAISEQLSKMNVMYIHIDALIWGMHKEDIKSIFEWLYDDESRSVLLEIMDSRISGRYPDQKIVSTNPYAPISDFCELNKNEVFVDCGAFVGDTAERFIWQRFGVFKKIIMIEPDPKNVKAINYRRERLLKEWGLEEDSLQVLPYAVSDISTVAEIDNSEVCSNLGTRMNMNGNGDGDSIEVVALDDIIHDQVTYLKADIESYEYKMLLGSRNIIKKYNPKLGICIYHNAVDLYSIPLLIKEINPNYKLMIRHYTPQLYDTVLYAW